VPHPDGDRIIVYVTKSRYDAPQGSKFILEWIRSTCTIADMSKFVMSNDALMNFACEENANKTPPVEKGEESKAVTKEADSSVLLGG
jgi:hypothetical protein